MSLVLISSLLVNPTKLIAEPLEITPELSLREQIAVYSAQYGTDKEILMKMIECESGWNESALGDNGRAYGLLQFHKASFDRMAKAFGEELDYKSSSDQIRLASWAIQNGYAREWTSYRAIKNGGHYSFYSNLLQKHFNVKCKL